MVKEKKEVEVKDRKSVIREHFLKVTERWKPEIIDGIAFQKSFDIRKVVELPETRGLLKQSLIDFKAEDKKKYREVCQDLKSEGILYHKAANYWVRLK